MRLFEHLVGKGRRGICWQNDRVLCDILILADFLSNAILIVTSMMVLLFVKIPKEYILLLFRDQNSNNSYQLQNSTLLRAYYEMIRYTFHKNQH